MGRLDGKIAIITGGARGQGASEAHLFVAEGATVYITDVLDELGEKTAASSGATFVHQDVTDPAGWQALVERVVAGTGRIDVLVNNAGILRWLTMENTPVEVWNQILAVNQTGVFLGMQAVAPVMKQQRSGSIVNISSMGGLRGGSPCFAYAATKWAVRGMTKGAAQELGPFNVRVNSVHPGLVDTPMVADFAGREFAAQRVPMGRECSPDEVASLVLFLASDESAYVSGAEISIDGGATA